MPEPAPHGPSGRDPCALHEAAAHSRPAFDAVLIVGPWARLPLAGMALFARAAFTLARAGAGRLLCVGAAPTIAVRLPPVPIAWSAADGPGVAAWTREAASLVVGIDAAVVTDPATVEALVRAPGRTALRAEGPPLLWRCAPSRLDAILASPAVRRALERSPAEDASGTPGVARADCSADGGELPGAERWPPPNGALLVRCDSSSARDTGEQALYARLGRPGDGWLTRHVDRRLSRALTRRLLPTGISPNQVTLGSIALGVASGMLFAIPSDGAGMIGAMVFLLSTIVDGCDGEIARLTFRESRLGAILDVVGDNVVHVFLFGGIATGLYRRSPDPGVATLGVLLVAGVLCSMGTVYWCTVRRPATRAQRVLFESFASREFAYALVVLALFGRLQWFLWAAAIGSYVFSGMLLLLGWRRPR